MMSMDVAKNRENFWANIDKEYYENNSSNQWRNTTLINGFVKEHNIESVLELGCNSGGNLKNIYTKFPYVKTTGIDICENAINHGINAENNKSEFYVRSVYDLSIFHDNSFDLVFTRGVLLHIPHDKIGGVIKEVIRIAKKYVLHVEWHGKNKIVSRPNNIPHAFTHNFKELYKHAGKPVSIKELHNKKGGANHCISIKI